MYDKLIKLYPELENKFLLDLGIIIQNDSDGKGDYIKSWNHPTLAEPTQEQLDAV